MKIKEKRWIGMDDLRKLCVNHSWFTRGNNDVYAEFLKMCCVPNITTTRILCMAKMIAKYSESETYELLGLDGVMFCLGEIAHTSFIIED